MRTVGRWEDRKKGRRANWALRLGKGERRNLARLGLSMPTHAEDEGDEVLTTSEVCQLTARQNSFDVSEPTYFRA